MQKNLKAAILAALLIAPAVSFAEESNFSWNASVVSDYVFRGISQSDRGEAFQGGLDYSFSDTGFYAGTWWSSVDFGNGNPNNEVDLYVGFNHDLSETINFDVMFTRYTYHGDGSSGWDFNEIVTKTSLKDVATLTLAYTDNWAGLGMNETYANIGHSWDLGKDYSLNAGFGRTFMSDDSYNDWNVGLSKAFDIGVVSLNYYDTNIEGPRASDSVVLSVKIGG